jgi:hypothetical protein
MQLLWIDHNFEGIRKELTPFEVKLEEHLPELWQQKPIFVKDHDHWYPFTVGGYYRRIIKIKKALKLANGNI